MTAADSSIDPLGDEPRVEVDVLAHRVVAHVLDAADEDDVGGAHRDLAGARGRRGERARAHAVDGEAGDRRRQPGEERDVAAEREPLVADLRRRGEDDVVDPLGRKLRVAPEQLAHGLHGHVVGARLREEAVRRRAAEGRADAVDVDHLAELGPRRDDTSGAMSDWEERARARRRATRTAHARLPEDAGRTPAPAHADGKRGLGGGARAPDARPRDEADEWLVRAAETYRRAGRTRRPGAGDGRSAR